MPEAVSEAVYRTEYEEEVESSAERYGVDKALVYAVIKTESNFNANAKSDIGAVGIMQITEQTFDWLSWRLKTDEYAFEDLYEPKVCIEYGTYFLGYLCEKYNDIGLAVAAYHAGAGKVDSWIESGDIDPENFSPEDIKGAKTAHYVEKVLKAYKKYSDILTKN